MSSLVYEFLRSIDKDGSGTIDPDELMAAVGNSGIEEKYFKQFVEEYDKDGDGKLNLKELETFLRGCGCL